jgi:predicted enzyme related to lactoylglutathione lyase
MVNDLQAYLNKAVSLGGKSLMPPTEIPGGFGSIAIFYDIAGNRISLFSSPE